VPQPEAGAVRAAIEDLIETFGAGYPRGEEFLKRVATTERAHLADFQREALAANPLVGGQPILFVARKQYMKDHHNTATLFQTGEINTRKYDPPGVLKMLDISNDWKVSTIYDPGPAGLVRDPEVSFDGKRIVFSMRRNIDDDYHIYEINVDGSGLKQLTSAPGVSDIDPLYLPEGGIAFSSTREPKFCMCNRHIMANLFKMEADGANIHQIGKSTLFEGHGALMPDGRILYDRWEYVDRNFGDAQGLWAVNPDGTGHAIYWGNNTASPGGVIDARIIPGTQLCLCIFGSCHDRPWGALAIIDRRKGVDGPDPVIRIWPSTARKLVSERIDKGYGYDFFKRVTPRYEDPYPLSEKHFLVARTTGEGEQTGIYLVDVFGNEVLLHTEEPGCFDPMPAAPRPIPPVKPAARNFADATGAFYVQDVYIGTHMEGVERGSIKYLRIVESAEKRNWTKLAWGGQGAQAPGMNWHNFENKRILGTVPVEADGSAYFEVPAECFVFFQALDKNGMLVQSMRSGTMIQPGETQGCVGCHENRVTDAPPPRALSALKRAPSRLNGWHGEPRLFSYMKQIQPIFDKHCLECHDFGKKGVDKLVLAGDRTISFNASYIDLQRQGLLSCVGGGPAHIQPAYSWGSHASKLIKILRDGHNDTTLSAEEMERLITWVDLNAPYYPVYESAYPDNPCGRSPLNTAQVKQLEKLTGARFVMAHNHGSRAQISFERPELSPCLATLEKGSPEYSKALEIIEAGRQRLLQTPRADMEGFIPCEGDRERLAKYEQRRRIEQRNRAAICEGQKVYDEDSAPPP
jgi:hypothetical protein